MFHFFGYSTFFSSYDLDVIDKDADNCSVDTYFYYENTMVYVNSLKTQSLKKK